MPLGVAGGVPHVAAVLLAIRLGSRRWTYSIAGLSTTLTILAYFLSPETGAFPWQVLANRLLAIFVIWATAILGHALRRADDATLKSERRIEPYSMLRWMR